MGKSILIADDPKQSLNSLASALTFHGFLTHLVPSAEVHQLRFADLHPDLIIVSVQNNNFTAICEGIRNDPIGAIVPIIYIGSGHETVNSPALAQRHGADYFFAHPVDIFQLLQKIHTYIGESNDDEELLLNFTATGEIVWPLPPASPLPGESLTNASDAILAQIASAEIAALPPQKVEPEPEAEPVAVVEPAPAKAIPTPKIEITDRERILAKAAQADNEDYFSLLGISPRSSRTEIIEAVSVLKEEFRKERFSPALQRQLWNELATIEAVLSDAAYVLEHDERRRAYASNLK